MKNNQKAYERFRLQWMIDHGYTLNDLVVELDKCLDEVDEDTSLQTVFDDWEYNFGFSSEIWPCYEEWLEGAFEE